MNKNHQQVLIEAWVECYEETGQFPRFNYLPKEDQYLIKQVKRLLYFKVEVLGKSLKEALIELKTTNLTNL